MKTVQVDREKLLATLKSNLAKHKKEYEEAVEGFKASRLELIKTIQAAATLAVNENTSFARKGLESAFEELKRLANPVDYSGSYEQAIMLMNWEERSTIDLTVDDFESYVRDNWNWRSAFKHLHSTYSNSGIR